MYVVTLAVHATMNRLSPRSTGAAEEAESGRFRGANDASLGLKRKASLVLAG